MTSVLIHLVVFTALNGMVVGVWYLTGADNGAFWPIWVLAPWGCALLIHAGVMLVTAPARRRRRGKRGAGAGKGDGPAWIAAMFTDLVGSSALAERMGDAAWAKLIAGYRRSIQGVVEGQGGAIIGTQGDGVLLRFDSPAQALRAAAAIQRRFARERDDGKRIPPVRVGIHAGEAVAVKGDVLGQMVNIAARIAAAAGPDEVLVSEPVADHAAPGTQFEDRGLHPLKGSDKPRHLLALRWRGYD